MKKNIKVIIKETNSHLGPVNTVQYVAPGYAFNYLIPNKLAEIASKGKIRHINMLNSIQTKQIDTRNRKNLIIKANLEKVSKINIRKKLGPNKQIFGRINENEITKELIKITGETIDKKQITIPNIKEVGIYNINIKIEENLRSTIKLHILPNTL